MAATNNDLEAQIQNNTFRTDLYYRLAAYRIHIPPLRERQEDIEPLINYFCQSFCEQNRIRMPSIDPLLIKEIVHYKFPGNVRELKNLVERALIINRDAVLSFDDFPFLNGEEQSNTSALDQAQIFQIKKALQEAGSNQSQAARALGISRYSLIRKMRKYGIE
jgi:DNA-binding NtrC family response regulator